MQDVVEKEEKVFNLHLKNPWYVLHFGVFDVTNPECYIDPQDDDLTSGSKVERLDGFLLIEMRPNEDMNVKSFGKIGQKLLGSIISSAVE